MYGEVLAVATPVVTTGTVVLLPNTGASTSIIAIAVSVFAGLIIWGVAYARANR